MSNCEKKPFCRLWLTSLTNEAIKSGFKQLQPGEVYNNLYMAAKCRSESDWVVGINGTRNFTVRYGKGTLWSIGRVQTPVLAMIVARDDEIRNFVLQNFWELFSTFKNVAFKYTGKRFDKKEKAEVAKAKVASHPFSITKIQSKQEKQQPSFFYMT